MEKLLNIKEVANILGVSTSTAIDLVRSGELPAYRVYGGRVDRESVTRETRSLRCRPQDLRTFLSLVAVK